MASRISRFAANSTWVEVIDGDDLLAADVALDGRLDTLEAADIALDGRLDTLEAADIALDGRLDVLEAVPTWTAVTLINNWINYGSGGYSDLKYCKIRYVVYLQGTIRGNGSPAATNPHFATLPVGIRPLTSIQIPIRVDTEPATYIDISSGTGAISMQGHTANATFGAASIAVSFLVL